MTPQPREFRDVYRAECSYVWRAMRRLGVRDSELEDLVHDTFVAAHWRWQSLDPLRPVRPWLYGIAFRVALDHHRKHSTHRELPTADLPDVPSAAAGPFELFERKEGLTLAQQIIEKLEIERRAVFVLHELEGVTMPEIAEAFEIPVNTAWSRLRLARRDFEAAAQQQTREVRQ